jgi:hypothetical protein
VVPKLKIEIPNHKNVLGNQMLQLKNRSRCIPNRKISIKNRFGGIGNLISWLRKPETYIFNRKLVVKFLMALYEHLKFSIGKLKGTIYDLKFWFLGLCLLNDLQGAQ